MKVLENGRPQKGWAKEYVCTGAGNKGGGCGAKLLVEQDDLFQTYASYMGREEEYFVTFKCPRCGVLTDIKKSDCPVPVYKLPDYRTWQRRKGESDE